MKPGITIIVRLGRYGDRVVEFALDLPPELTCELGEPIERSDNPFALIRQSLPDRDYIKHRQKVFRLRNTTARQIAAELTAKLVTAFGIDDETDGYSLQELG